VFDVEETVGEVRIDGIIIIIIIMYENGREKRPR